MKKDFKAITINLDAEVYDLLKAMQTPKKPSISFIVREILLDYFISSEKKQEPVVIYGEPLRKKTEEPDNYAIRVAQRAKNMGRDYDKSLEPYLDGNTKD